jgi:hypothetical protein
VGSWGENWRLFSLVEVLGLSISLLFFSLWLRLLAAGPFMDMDGLAGSHFFHIIFMVAFSWAHLEERLCNFTIDYDGVLTATIWFCLLFACNV